MLTLTLLVMQRGKYDAVTQKGHLPVLIPTSAEQREGWTTFTQELGPPESVRMLKNSDLKNARKHLTEWEAQHLHAIIALIQALQKPADSIALTRATEAVTKAHELQRVQRSDRRLTAGLDPKAEADLGHALAHLIGLPPQQAIEHFERLRPGPRASQDPRWLLSYEVSMELDDARLVLWWSEDGLKPAIWCREMRTGFYARALLSVVGAKGLRICPHCGEPFLQERSDQDYCSVAHREAHRVARWRSQRKKAAISKGSKGGCLKPSQRQAKLKWWNREGKVRKAQERARKKESRK